MHVMAVGEQGIQQRAAKGEQRFGVAGEQEKFHSQQYLSMAESQAAMGLYG
ncbi:hypothetical protein D3C78_1458390 [compost metagenome]